MDHSQYAVLTVSALTVATSPLSHYVAIAHWLLGKSSRSSLLTWASLPGLCWASHSTGMDCVFTLHSVAAFITAIIHYLQFQYWQLHPIFKASALWADAFYKLKCPSACPCVRLSVRLSVRVFTFEVPFKRLFAPTSQSRMPNIFRDSESLGKTNGKKGSQIGTFFLEVV